MQRAQLCGPGGEGGNENLMDGAHHPLRGVGEREQHQLETLEGGRKKKQSKQIFEGMRRVRRSRDVPGLWLRKLLLKQELPEILS